MWSNFIKIARRKLWSKKGNTFTKLFSLSIGIVSLFYIAIYIQKELSFDKFHSNYPKIAKVNTTVQSPTGDIALGLSATPVAPYIKSQSPEVKEFVRINKEYGSHALRVGDKLFSESENIYYADPTFFKVFDFQLLYGNSSSALVGPDKIVITEQTALKYFESVNALNKIIEYDGEPFTVSGIVQNLPSNSHLQFDFLVSMDTFMKSRLPDINDNWTWFPMNTYLLLEDNKNIAAVEQQLKLVPQYQERSATNDQYILSAEALNGFHFSNPKHGDLGAKGKLSNLYLLFAIGIMILLLAVSNFINLTTAQVATQEREVSVKKTIGASKSDIFKQFFVESILLTSLASLISLIIISVSLPYFENFLGGQFDISFLLKPSVIILLLISPVILALLAGIYPAFKFANISTTHLVKHHDNRFRIFNTRTGLLILQFSITSVLVIGSLIIYYQLNYIQNRDLGIETARKIVLDYGPNSQIGTSFEVLKEEFAQISGVESVSFSSHVPGQIPNGVATQIMDLRGRSNNGEINLNLVDYDFLKNYGLQIVAGRDFRKGVADQNNALILNEAAVKAFGYSNPEDVIGASFEQWGGNGEVIGVVKDFNYLSLHEDIGLLSLKIWPEQFMKVTMEISDSNFGQTLEVLQHKWATLYPEIPFNHYQVEDNFRAQYDRDKQFAGIINLFTIVSICIGILGLIAYSKFWCERRRKEMSIRKVLGANISLLVWKLYSGFSLPVLIGFILAVPVAYYLGGKWLQEFAYQFELNWYFFVLPLVFLLVFAWIAVGTQTIKLALINPVEHLKEE
ncbi:ABC transporter permease [Muriicola sp. Z0-33]|uniref:ABC transporter permease n=1 Tax=Muriicola sp. Z0-33 TaxID=2816957 RepID=UPI0022372383|nr:ABC transporter permease [Muriicola sp. Z0-33]MCW5515045.1 ABC transporter permease [Muriicola sp. Z0-33]